jgi:hypothetical protein
VKHEYASPDAWDEPKIPEKSAERWPFLRGSWWRQQWTRFTGRFRRSDPGVDPLQVPPPPLAMPSLLNIHEPSEEFTIETPALGDAYNFKVRVRCSWCVQATANEEEKDQKIAQVREFIEESRAITKDRIEALVRPVARTFPPYRAAEAEAALNDEIVDCLNDGDVRVKVRTWVDVSDPVREDLQQVWKVRLFADAEGDKKKAGVQLLSELQDAWQKLLIMGLERIGAMDDAKIGWLAPYALALAEEPLNAPGYLQEILEKRVGHAEELLEKLGLLAIDNRFEAIEFAFQSESTLRALLTYLGVPIPSIESAGATSGGSGDV